MNIYDDDDDHNCLSAISANKGFNWNQRPISKKKKIICMVPPNPAPFPFWKALVKQRVNCHEDQCDVEISTNGQITGVKKFKNRFWFGPERVN